MFSLRLLPYIITAMLSSSIGFLCGLWWASATWPERPQPPESPHGDYPHIG